MLSFADHSPDFQAAFTHSWDGIMITGLNGEVFAANPAACRLLGREEQEIVQLGRAVVIDPGDPEVLRALEIRKNTGSFQGELTFVRKGGEKFPVEVSTSLFDHPGGAQRTVMIFRDITERKHMGEQLRLSEEKFARVFFSSPDGITITRRSDGRYLEVNPGFTATSGYQVAEVLGRTPMELGIWLSPEDRAGFVKELEENGEVLNREYDFQFKGGRICTTLVSARFIEVGGVACILSTTRDITERKRLEESLLLTQKLESIGVLAGGIAHDFNNMLAGLLGFVELAEEMAVQGRYEKVETYLKKALAIYPRARGLTRQLLTFSKGGEPVRTTVALGPLVRSSALFSLSGSNVLAEFDLPEDLWPCSCDEGQIGQAIDNLVLNAVQAMPRGGTIRLTARNLPEVPGHFGRLVKVSIADEGPGIAPEILPRIFEPFVTTKASGHGLGLAAVFSVMHRHKGWVEVSSVTGEGATFHLFLPVSEASQCPDTGVAESIAPQGGGTILVMDDDPHVLEVATLWLESLGYQVRPCGNCAQAWEAILASQTQGPRFRAALLDLTIPGGEGGMVLARRLAQVDPALVLIASTGYSEDPELARPTDDPFHGRLRKPFQKKDLSQIFGSLVPRV